MGEQTLQQAEQSSPPINLSHNDGYSRDAALATDGIGNVHVVWADDTLGNLDTFYSHWDGVAWSEPEPISQTVGLSYWPAVTVDANGTVHVVWDENYGDQAHRIFYSRKDGAGWTEPVLLSGNIDWCVFPDIAADGQGRLHVVWDYYQIAIYHTEWDGAAWSSPSLVAEGGRPTIVAGSGDEIHLVWDVFPSTIEYNKWNGTAWLAPTVVYEASPLEPPFCGWCEYVSDAVLAVEDTGTIHVVWEKWGNNENGHNFGEVLHRWGDGENWSGVSNISESTNQSWRQAVAVDGEGRLHVVWYELADQGEKGWYGPGDHDPGVRYRVWDGNGWSEDIYLTNYAPTGGFGLAADVAVDGLDGVHMVWGEENDVFYTRNPGIEGPPTLGLSVTAPARLEEVNGLYSPNPFPVTATVTNTGGVTATGTLLTITLPVSLTLEAGQSYTQTVGELGVGQSGVVTWSVTAITQTQDITLTYIVDAGAENTGVVSETKEVFVPGVPPPPTPTPTPTPTITPTPTPTWLPVPPLPFAEFKGANYLHFPKEGETYAGKGVGWNLDVAENILHKEWYNLGPGIDALKNDQHIYTIARLAFSLQPPVAALDPGDSCDLLGDWMDALDTEYRDTLAQVSDKDAMPVFILGNEPNLDWGLTGKQYAHAYNCYYWRWRWEENRQHALYAAGPGGGGVQDKEQFYNGMFSVDGGIMRADGFALHAYGYNSVNDPDGNGFQGWYEDELDDKINQNPNLKGTTVMITEYNPGGVVAHATPYPPPSNDWANWFDQTYGWVDSQGPQMRALLYFVDEEDADRDKENQQADWWNASLRAHETWRKCWLAAPNARSTLCGSITGSQTMSFSTAGLPTNRRYQGDIGGVISGTLGHFGYDLIYGVTEDLEVPAGATLTIAPGTTLVFSPGRRLVVAGQLVAEGNSVFPVYFLSTDEAGWGGIEFRPSSAGSRCDACYLQNVETGGTALRVEAPISFRYGLIRDVPGGTAISTQGTGSTEIAYSLLYANGQSYATGPDAQLVLGEGLLSADPAFVSFPDNLRLQPDSPAVNAADPQADYSQELGYNGGRTDMGAYGNTMDAPERPPLDQMAVSLWATPTALSGAPGTVITYAVTVKNSGTVTDSYVLRVERESFRAKVAEGRNYDGRYFPAVPPQAEVTLPVWVEIPQDAAPGAQDTTTVRVSGVYVTRAELLLTTTVELPPTPTPTPAVDAGADQRADEGEEIGFSGTITDGLDTYTIQWDFGDGATASGTLTPTHTYADNDVYTVTLTVTVNGDAVGSDTLLATVDNVAPVVGPITAPMDPFAVNTTITASATFTDAGLLDTHTALWDWGDGHTSPGIIEETGGSGTVTGTHTYTMTGVYTVRLAVTDDDGGSDESTFRYIVVYDPEGGFVTGGGWIQSPEGAYTLDPSLTGKANFGFVSRYKKGANVPTGNTQFQFKVADLNFHSDTYEWLVISGARARYKGVGAINGQGVYKFLLTAVDADINPNDSIEVDRFRIKIWVEDEQGNETVVYDNGVGAEDHPDDPTVGTTEIGGGSIVIHQD